MQQRILVLTFNLGCLACAWSISNSKNPYDIECRVDDRRSMKCSFNPLNNSDLTLCYSSCYACMDKHLDFCPQFVNHTCTWLERSAKNRSSIFYQRQMTYTLFVCDGNSRIPVESSKMEFSFKNMVKPSPVDGLRYELRNNHVKISWNRSGKTIFLYKITLRDNCSRLITEDTTSEASFSYQSLRPHQHYQINLRCKTKEGRYWSHPSSLSFETGEGDFGHFGLVELLGFQTLRSNESLIDILLHWKVQDDDDVAVENFSMNISTLAHGDSTTVAQHASSHSRRTQVTLNSTCILYKVILGALVSDGSRSHSELIISLDAELSRMPEDLLLITDNSKILLSWTKDEIANASLFLYNDLSSQLETNENNSQVPDLVSLGLVNGSATGIEFQSFGGHRPFISFQKMEYLDSKWIFVHGSMSLIPCRYYLNSDLVPPSKLRYQKDAEVGVLALEWTNPLDCGSRYFTHTVVEYYPTDCETCPLPRHVDIPRLVNNWTIEGLPSGPYQLRMKAVCNMTGKESIYTNYITVKVSTRNSFQKFAIPISLCSIVALLVAGSIIGSRTCSSVKSKVIIRVPDSPFTSYPAMKEKHLYHLSNVILYPLQKAKSFYKILFDSDNTVDSSQSQYLDKQNSFAWWNPSYRSYQKGSFGSSLSLPSEKHQLYENEYENFYFKEKGVLEGLDLYSSVKILNF